MSLFGSHRDDRRRRAMAEDSAGGGSSVATVAPSAKPGGKVERYTAAARPEHHRRLTDLLPQRGWTLALAYLAALTIVAGLLAGYAACGDLPERAASVARLLDASQGGSLAGWFSSVAFAWAAAGSVLVYSIRRHKLDDYRARYRLWLWSAAAWLVMSIDAVANLHAPFSQAMKLVTGGTMTPDGAVWWIGAWGTILAILALRLTIEMRESRIAAASIVAVAALWTVALAIEYGWLRVGQDAALIATGCRLVGQVTLLLALGAYARHVLLDAQGLFTVRPAKPKRAKVEAKATAASDSSKTTRIDSAHRPAEKLQPHASTGARPASVTASSSFSANRSASAQADNEDDDRYGNYNQYEEEEFDSANRKLSKAERKRLRKMMRRQGRDEDE